MESQATPAARAKPLQIEPCEPRQVSGCGGNPPLVTHLLHPVPACGPTQRLPLIRAWAVGPEMLSVVQGLLQRGLPLALARGVAVPAGLGALRYFGSGHAPKAAKSLVFSDFGAPEDVLSLEHHPLREPGEGEVVINILAVRPWGCLQRAGAAAPLQRTRVADAPAAAVPIPAGPGPCASAGPAPPPALSHSVQPLACAGAHQPLRHQHS